MSERWTSPKDGPFPSGHLVVGVRFGLEDPPAVMRCGRTAAITDDWRRAIASEPPSTSEGRTCETCLRLANRDHRVGSGEDDGSTQPVESVL